MGKERLAMQQIPKNMPKAPDFDNITDMLKWYKKAYRIPRLKNKAKRLSKTVPRNLLNRINISLGRNNTLPKEVLQRGVLTKNLQKHLLNQFDNMLNDAEKQIKQRYKDPTIRSQLLKGALGKASGVLSLLVPSSLDQENTMELPFPQSPFPVEDAQIRQQRMNQLTPRAGYYGGGIVQPTAPKTKRKKRKTKKPTTWNY